MKTFEEIVKKVANEYGECLTDKQVREVWESLSPEMQWQGTYYGWNQWSINQDIIQVTHKYMLERESC